MAHAVFLAAEREAVFDLVVQEVGRQVEVEAVTDPVGCRFEGLCGGRAAPVRRAGSEADDEKATLRVAWDVNDRSPGLRNGTCGAAGDRLLDDEAGVCSTGGQCSSFGHSGAPDFGHDDIGRVGEAFGNSIEVGYREEAGRDVQMVGQGMNCGFVGLEVD
jgi:hypothetical protein